MNSQQYTIIECPDCGERYLIVPQNITPSELAKRYSDGFFTDPVNWRTPGIIGCVTCELGFFPENGKIVGTTSDAESYKKAEPPTAGALALELRVRKQMDERIEKIIRTELWYSGNHTEYGKHLLQNNTRFKAFWLENLQLLNNIMNLTQYNDRLQKAEINRQLSQFETCIKLINSTQDPLAKAIKDQAHLQNPAVFYIQ